MQVFFTKLLFYIKKLETIAIKNAEKNSKKKHGKCTKIIL